MSCRRCSRNLIFAGSLQLVTSWGLIAASFAIVGFWPHLPTIVFPVVVALIVLGNRHLALAILVHDACHHALFKTRWLNEFAGKWFAAAPVLQDLEGYRKYHLQHHKYTGQDYQVKKVTQTLFSRATTRFRKKASGVG